MVDDERPGRFKRVSLFILLSLGTGILLSLFTQLQGIVRFVFSLGALYLGILAFRHYETWGVRIGYIALSLFVFVLATAVITAILIANGRIQLPAA